MRPPPPLPPRRDVAPKVAVHWYNRRKGADTAVSLALCRGFRGVCTGRFTVNYVAGSSADSNGAAHFTGPAPVVRVRVRDA